MPQPFEIKTGAIIGDAPINANPNANFETKSTDKGWLPNRLTTAQRTAIAGLTAADKGLIAFDTDTNTYWFYDGTAWIELTAGGSSNYKGALAASPMSGSAGDWYYNTATGEQVSYDATRSKWLAVATQELQFGRSGNMGNGGTFMAEGSAIMTINNGSTASIIGIPIPFDCTVTGFTFTCQANITNDATFECYVDNNVVSFFSQALATPNKQALVNNVNVDLLAGSVIGVRMFKSGDTLGTVSNGTGFFTIKRTY